jgi:hypothetical protein
MSAQPVNKIFYLHFLQVLQTLKGAVIFFFGVLSNKTMKKLSFHTKRDSQSDSVNKITLIFSKKILFGFWSLILTMGCFLYGRVGVAKTSVIGYLVGLFL